MPDSRLIEHAFPLKQASLDSVHEKNVRHGHISTLHIWPARRPLAACRAALIATLLPDPGTPEARQALCEKIGGKVKKVVERKKMPDGSVVEREKEETEGGILHWGRETENAKDLEWFRKEIRKAYGGRAPRVLDPFAGGGAIPLEAMRLGCEATAIDINPVAWFILKCTLEYPQKLAGQTHPLPDFILDNQEFMERFYKAHPHLVGRTKLTEKQKRAAEYELFPRGNKDTERAPKADLAWHVRAWGQWVLDRARRELAQFYPTYADFEPADLKSSKAYEKQPMRLVPLKEDGTADVDKLNAEFSQEYLTDRRNPRWVAKPTVAYLWARTVTCKNCRATIPLLKTRWLCKKKDGKKRVVLTMAPNAERTGVVFGIREGVPVEGANAAQRREFDKRVGAGTMSRAGAQCACCGAIMTMEDTRVEGQGQRLGSILCAVVRNGAAGKEYRTPLDDRADGILPMRPSPASAGEDLIPNNPRRFATPLYGMRTFASLFTGRQQLTLRTFIRHTNRVMSELQRAGYPEDWQEGVPAYLALAVDRVADYGSSICTWINSMEIVRNTFGRFALPMVWDFCEPNPLSESSGNYDGCLDWESKACEHLLAACGGPAPHVERRSATSEGHARFDLVVTDPPYYDSIPYCDISNFFYPWLRLMVPDKSAASFRDPVIPYTGELVMDRMHESLAEPRSKQYYETGMSTAFRRMHEVLADDGKLVMVFAHKEPDAWGTLVSAIIQAGFVVEGSWPIQTERANRANAVGTASLASSVWLVCRKRPPSARPGWDNQVLADMRAKIRTQLREFWDAGIRGPDFVWAATGPALEAYSAHPVVRKANEPGTLTVAEFLSHVRRMVIDFVVGRVLTGDRGEIDDSERLDEPTAYYLLHRNDFGLDEAPAGACILYAVSCGLSDKELADTWDLIASTKGKQADDEDDDEPGADDDGDGQESGSKIKLKTWSQRHGKSMGLDAPGGRPIPLIDRVHRLMHLWKAGELIKVDDYLDQNGLRRQELFKRLLQSLIELAPRGSEERALLESLSNHVQAKGAAMPSLFGREA